MCLGFRVCMAKCRRSCLDLLDSVALAGTPKEPALRDTRLGPRGVRSCTVTCSVGPQYDM